jgi:antitoxin VapB
MQQVRTASLFRNGRNQALRIPREFEFEGTEVIVRKEGTRLIIDPVKTKPTLLELLATFEALDEEFPTIEDLPLPIDEQIF